MPNPTGINGMPFTEEPPYGAIAKQRSLARSAPMAGAPTSALETPRRFKRRAVRGQQPAAPQAAPPPGAGLAAPAPPPLPEVPYPQQVAKVWADMAAIPGASDLVLAYAERAQEDADRG